MQAEENTAGLATPQENAFSDIKDIHLQLVQITDSFVNIPT
jgi:hypothetical protein